MTTAAASTGAELATIDEPLFSQEEQTALAGFLAGYSGPTRDAYSLDLRMYTAWCVQRGLHLFTARRADIECFGRNLEIAGRARATIARRLCTIAGFYRYAVEEELLDHPRQRMCAGAGWITNPMPPRWIATNLARCWWPLAWVRRRSTRWSPCSR